MWSEFVRYNGVIGFLAYDNVSLYDRRRRCGDGNAVRELVYGPAVEEMITRGNDLGRAGLAIFVHVVVQELSRLAVIRRRYGTAAGYEELIFGHDHIALRRHASKRRAFVRLHGERRATAAIVPYNLPALGVDCIDKGSHEGPNPGGEIDCVLVQNRTATHGPHADQTIISKHPVWAGAGEELADHRAILRA